MNLALIKRRLIDAEILRFSQNDGEDGSEWPRLMVGKNPETLHENAIETVNWKLYFELVYVRGAGSDETEVGGAEFFAACSTPIELLRQPRRAWLLKPIAALRRSAEPNRSGPWQHQGPLLLRDPAGRIA